MNNMAKEYCQAYCQLGVGQQQQQLRRCDSLRLSKPPYHIHTLEPGGKQSNPVDSGNCFTQTAIDRPACAGFLLEKATSVNLTSGGSEFVSDIQS